MILTTGDLKEKYTVIGPVYFQVSNKGIFSSPFSKMKKKYAQEIKELKEKGLAGGHQIDWGFLYGELSLAGKNDFDIAFFISAQELKKRAKILNADAIIGMRQDIDLDTNHFQFFYLQMYGTAVKIVK